MRPRKGDNTGKAVTVNFKNEKEQKMGRETRQGGLFPENIET